MARKQPGKPILILPNISDISFYMPAESIDKQTLSILYCGTIGIANQLEHLIACARESLKNNLPIEFTIIGDGARKPAILKLASELENVTVLDFTNRDGLKSVIDTHDARL